MDTRSDDCWKSKVDAFIYVSTAVQNEKVNLSWILLTPCPLTILSALKKLLLNYTEVKPIILRSIDLYIIKQLVLLLTLRVFSDHWRQTDAGLKCFDTLQMHHTVSYLKSSPGSAACLSALKLPWSWTESFFFSSEILKQGSLEFLRHLHCNVYRGVYYEKNLRFLFVYAIYRMD